MTEKDARDETGATDKTDQRRVEGFRRDLAVLAYLEAWEADDLDTMQSLWERAESDAELERALGELSEGLAQELGPSPGWHDDAAKVADLVARHLPSAAGPRPVTDPLTAGDVAARIASDAALLSKLGPKDRQANARLLADPTPLPGDLSVPRLREWSAGLPVQAAESYWRVFRHAAVVLGLGRSYRLNQQAGAAPGGFLAAARRPEPPASPKGTAKDKNKPGTGKDRKDKGKST